MNKFFREFAPRIGLIEPPEDSKSNRNLFIALSEGIAGSEIHIRIFLLPWIFYIWMSLLFVVCFRCTVWARSILGQPILCMVTYAETKCTRLQICPGLTSEFNTTRTLFLMVIRWLPISMKLANVSIEKPFLIQTVSMSQVMTTRCWMNSQGLPRNNTWPSLFTFLGRKRRPLSSIQRELTPQNETSSCANFASMVILLI